VCRPALQIGSRVSEQLSEGASCGSQEIVSCLIREVVGDLESAVRVLRAGALGGSTSVARLGLPTRVGGNGSGVPIGD
jgi:hypothetical protein